MANLRLFPAGIQAALIENSNDCIAVLAADGRTVFQSPAISNQLGYLPDELIGRYNYSLVHPDDRAAAITRFRAVFEGEATPAPLRLRCRHKNGTWRILELMTWRLVEAPHPPFVVLNARDVTEITETTAALRASEHRLDLALELGAMGVTDFSYETGKLIFSASFTRLMGYDTPPPDLGLSWFLQHVHADDRAPLAAVFNAIKKPAVDEYEMLFRMIRDGRLRWWSGRVRIIRGEDGEPTQALGLVCDITEQRHLEEQVLQAQKMEAMGRLAGGVAHDFNNLLTVISGYADTLLKSVAPADPRFDDVVEIQRAADRAAVLTQQLLAFSRKQILRLIVFDVNAVVRDIATMIGRLLGSRIELHINLGADPAAVRADRGQLEQVLINLAVNGRDAMPNGGVLTIHTALIEITTADTVPLYQSKPGRYVRLSVSDTGIGMPPDVQARVFEPFFTTKEPGKGTGIGLATVYGIVKQSGGFILLTSEPESGTTFDVYLPHASRAAVTPTRAGVRPEESRAGEVTVLLVEDLRRVRELGRKILTREGYRVLTAESGSQALDLARNSSERIDLLLTDVVMPGMSGPELVRALQGIRPDTAVVYMSGYTGDVLDEQGIDRDDAAFLEKPFTPAALSRTVREALAARERRA